MKGSEHADTGRIHGDQAPKPDYGRRRDQQKCRDWWRRRYGADAERASRGGVTWLG